MKKVSLFLLALAFIGTVLSSCKSHEKCPAYGKISKQETTTVNS